MYRFESVRINTGVALLIALCSVVVDSQTYCSLKFAATDTSVCDAIGTLEENVNAKIFQTKGNVEVMQEYQDGTFEILDQQVNEILKHEQTTKADVTGLEEEVTALKKVLVNAQTYQMTTTSGSSARSKRASGFGSPNPAQQALDAAKVTFQQNVTDALQQLQNISKILDNEFKASAAQHATMLQEVSNNKQDLTSVEKQLKSLDSAIRQAIASKAQVSKPSGVNLASVTQDVTQLVIQATVAENVAQRQFDNDEKLIQQMELAEQKVDSDIQTVNATLNQADQDINNETAQISTLSGAEQFIENQVDTFINTTTNEINSLTTAVNTVNRSFSKVGNDLLQPNIDRNSLSRDLNTYRLKVDGIQSLVTFTKKTQQKQLGDLLNIKRDVIDDLNVLKFAFGLLTQVP